jgi:hypothetical protein
MDGAGGAEGRSSRDDLAGADRNLEPVASLRRRVSHVASPALWDL